MGGPGSGNFISKPQRLGPESRCTRCLIRWRQSKLGLCRRCEHELGIEALGNREREARNIAAREEKIEKLRAPNRQFVAAVSRTPRVLVLSPGVITGALKHLDYIVIWDGSMDGAVGMGIPMAHERGKGWTGTPIKPFRGERRGALLRRPGAFEQD